MRKKQFKKAEKKDNLKEWQGPPWSLHIGIFWKSHFITCLMKDSLTKKLQTSQKKPKRKKSRTTLGSSFGSSAILLQRPTAFRPLLTKGLAFSGFRPFTIADHLSNWAITLSYWKLFLSSFFMNPKPPQTLQTLNPWASLQTLPDPLQPGQKVIPYFSELNLSAIFVLFTDFTPTLLLKRRILAALVIYLRQGSFSGRQPCDMD